MVLFVPLFCLAFIFLYHPEGFNHIGDTSFLNLHLSADTSWHLIIFAMVLMGMMVAAVSRWLMHVYTKKHTLTYFSYILWILSEILAMTLIYSAISSYFSLTPFFVIYNTVFLKVVRILLIPYVMSYVYFIWQDKSRQLKLMKRRYEEKEKKEAQEEKEKMPNRAYIQLFDERGKMQLSIRRENLLFISSSDNYVTVWYLNNNFPKHVMIRNTLKNMSASMEGTNVLRCHRSYMVNFDHVKLLRREKDGNYIEMGIEGVPDIPISKTYSESITRWMMSENALE